MRMMINYEGRIRTVDEARITTPGNGKLYLSGKTATNFRQRKPYTVVIELDKELQREIANAYEKGNRT